MTSVKKRGKGSKQRSHKIVVPRNLPPESFYRPDPILNSLYQKIHSLPSPKWREFEKKYPTYGVKLRVIFEAETKKYREVEMVAIRRKLILDKFQNAYRPVKKCFPQFIQLLQGMTGVWFKSSAMPNIVKALRDFQAIMQRDAPEVRNRLKQRKHGRGRDSMVTPFSQRRLVSRSIHKA